MKESSKIDYMAIRERIIRLKKEAKLKSFDFCKIYAPEKCISKTSAENYISAISTGRDYPDQKHGPIEPDLEHLKNLVDSDLFPDVTLDYLVYGNKTPVKTIKEVDIDPHHWTIADFCIFLGKLLDAHGANIKIETIEEDDTIPVSYDEEISATMHYIAIKILEHDGFASSGYDLGNAISEFVLQIEKMKQIPSKTAQKVMYDQLIKAIESDERFSKELLTSRGQDSFFRYDDSGQVFEGLEIG